MSTLLFNCIYCDPHTGFATFFVGISDFGPICTRCIEWERRWKSWSDLLKTRSVFCVDSNSLIEEKLSIDILEDAQILLQDSAINHFMIPNVFSVKQCSKLKEYLKGDREPINFKGGELRFQKTIFANWIRDPVKRQTEVEDFMMKFMYYFRNAYFYTVKLLESEPGCREQIMHTDDPSFTQSNEIDRLRNATFSMIIALEKSDNPTRINLRDNGMVTIPQGHMLLMRGDCWHAGAGYDQHNVRLFIATGNYFFSNDGKSVLPEKNSSESSSDKPRCKRKI